MKLRTGSLSLLILAANVMAATAPYPGNDSDHGTVPYQKLINLYTGNVQLLTADLRVSGALGQYGLGFGRIANSRSTMGSPVFGLGHNWSHNWQWEMVDSGADSQGRPVLSVREPAGRE